MAMWNPWRGCHKISDGCMYCYIHKGDKKRKIDTNNIVKTDEFTAPIEKNSKGEYIIRSGQLVYLCFSSDFLLPEADAWRESCWKIMKERSDLTFVFLTKRISRFMQCMPEDWGSGYPNVVIGCTVENQERADECLSIFKELPIIHKQVICQPLLESIQIEEYLDDIECVLVGGESDVKARPLNYDWVLSIRQQCINTQTNFEFRQCGTHFIKDNKYYKLKVSQLANQAKMANIDYRVSNEH